MIILECGGARVWSKLFKKRLKGAGSGPAGVGA